MRFSALQCLLLALFAVLVPVAMALDDDIPAPMQALMSDPTENAKPKLLRPKKGFMKEDHDLDNQRVKADLEIAENAEDNQPEGERVVSSVDDLSVEDLLAMLHAANRRRDEL